MARTIGILFLALIGLGLLELTPAEVSHEEIRGTIQSLIYSYNQLDNKLERHEHRERALGELLKKAMQSLQKGQKGLEPINDSFRRLDDRVNQIESMLLRHEQKYNDQSAKLDDIVASITKRMDETNGCNKRLTEIASAAVVAAPIVAAPSAIPPEFVLQQEKLNKQLLAQVQQLSANVEKLLDTSKHMMAQTEVTFKSVPSTAEMLTKIDDKLVSYSVATAAPAPVLEPIDNTEFENKVFEKFAELGTDLAELRSQPKCKEELSSADKEFMQGLANETLSALEHAKVESFSATDKALALTNSHIKTAEQSSAANMAAVLQGVSNSTAVLDKFYTKVNSSYSKLHEALDIVAKFNNILLTNSEYVLDTQRKVEFGTLQVVQKINELLDRQRDELSAQLKERFDNVDESIVNNQLEAAQNLSSLIEAEISHVWRQISILTGEITDSKDLLTMLHGRNEAYVNTTFSTMDSMSSKVENIKGHMTDMDDNLNYLLGRLSLMSQEFSNIKVGLAESLEQLRNTFHTMQEKIPQQGPGPHNIAKNEYETELNLLKKRQT